MTTNFSQFDTNPSAINSWLENLPIASVGETARQLYMAMRDVNRQESVPVKHHFHLLEGISAPLEMILPELHRHYAGKPLPLSQKRRKVADLYSQLLRQTILGYQQVIAHSIDLSRFGWKKVVTTAVHRIFYYSTLLLSNYRQLYMPYQKGMWQQLYWIYQLVEKYNLLNAKVMGLGESPAKSTIASEFTKLLLNSLLSPNLFKPSELKQVLTNLDMWVQYVSVKSFRPDEDSTAYAFTLEADYPPGLIAQNMSQAENQLIDVRYLDITKLLTQLNKLLNNAKPGMDEINLGKGCVTSRRTLIILINNWGRPPTRDGERHLIHGHAEVAIGVSAIHYVISNGRKSAASDKISNDNNTVVRLPGSLKSQDDDQFTISIPPTAHRAGPLHPADIMTSHETSEDIWESAYFEPDEPAPSWTESMRMKVYSYLNAKVMNISKGGFCIALPQDGVEHIQTNELVAVRGKKGQWQLGEIRWMICPTSGPIRAGIQKHSPSITPAEIRIKSDIKSQPLKCLLGKNENGYVLFLPSMLTRLYDRKIQLDVDGQTRSIRLLDSLFKTPVSAAYQIEFTDVETNDHHSSAETDSYDSIWAGL